MKRYLASVGLVLSLLVLSAAAGGDEDAQNLSPHNECKNPPTPYVPVDVMQIETYTDLINATFKLHPNDQADRVEAGKVLGEWLTGCLEKKTPPASVATCNTCKSGCYKNGKWDYVCLSACVYNKQCP